jgi:hypothetical protein
MAGIPFHLGTEKTVNMTEYTSSVQTIPYSAERVFAKLSDLSNLEALKPMLGNQVKEFSCDKDSCTFKLEAFGTAGVQVLEREEFKTIKIGSVQSPIEFIGWVQLVEAAPDDTRLKLIFKVDLPFMLKAMLSGKIEEGIEKAAAALAALTY